MPPPPPRLIRVKFGIIKVLKSMKFVQTLKLNWYDLFSNLNGHEKCLVFTDTFLDIMGKHILNKIITCNDKDAPWMTPEENG